MIPYLWLFELLLLLLFLLFLGIGIIYALFRRLIKERFPLSWEEMGAPTFLNQSISSVWITYDYVILRAKYRNIPDKSIKRLGDGVRMMYFAFMIVFTAYIVFFFALR